MKKEQIVLQLNNVAKSYGHIQALQQTNLKLECGIAALVGPNGCGKSTMIGLLTDTLGRDQGEVLFGGIDILKLGSAYRARLGYLPQDCSTDPDLSVYSFLWYMGKLKAIPDKPLRSQIDKWISLLNLEDITKRAAGKLSGGQKQRVLVAQAMLGEPSVIILDEPMSGLDPEERQRFATTLRTVSKQSIILMATHIIADVNLVADTVIIMKKGQILAHAFPDVLCHHTGEATLEGAVVKLLRQDKNAST